MDHGHALLIQVLEDRRPSWLRRKGITMLEIGSTREALPSQDSTRKLAEFCQQHGWRFTTCDMDPANTERAAALFESMGVPFEAVTDKGEDYVSRTTKEFDVVYVDAYDFDHGKHSAARQARYEEFLGSRIDQRDCEIMHLEVMKGLNRSGRRNCLVVIDDTWQKEPNGPWLGKGPLAVPWALTHGWDLIEVDSDRKAVVLERMSPGRQLISPFFAPRPVGV